MCDLTWWGMSRAAASGPPPFGSRMENGIDRNPGIREIRLESSDPIPDA